MKCTHDGTNASPATFALSCTVNPGPLPEYTSNPAAGTPIALGPTEQNDPDPTANVSISNTGDAGPLTGTCEIMAGGDSQITLTSYGTFSVAEGGAVDIETVSCDATAAPNTYNATLSCSYVASNASPATYAVSCTITPPGEAIFRSDPMPGPIDMTPGDNPWVGAPSPTSTLTFYNDADQGDSDLGLSCTLSGSAEITVAPDLSGGISIGPGSSSAVIFTCATTEALNYSATYTCPYTTDGGVESPAGVSGSPAVYTVTCDVRDAMSDVDPMPTSGTPLLIPVDSGGTGTAVVVFEEVADEGVDGEVSCTLANDTAFHIISPTFPPSATISAGAPVTVTVEGTDDGSSPTDTLTCTYTDTANPEGTDAVYPLELVVGGETTTIDVTKVFTDDNPGEVRVTLTCDTGLPLEQFFDISEGSGVKFVVTSFESGTMNCSVTEKATSSYSGTYVASGDSASVDDDPDAPGCHFLAIEGGDGNACSITNSPDSVDVVIEKEWLFAGSFSDLEIYYELTLYCDAEIVGGDPYYNGTSNGPASISDTWYLEFEGTSPDNATFTAEVIPGYPSSDCWVEEEVFSDAVEVDNGCGDLVVSAGNGDSCTVTNTVFFEGIPTLNQYGLAIMALLMLGIGMVGFRRFS